MLCLLRDVKKRRQYRKIFYYYENDFFYKCKTFINRIHILQLNYMKNGITKLTFVVLETNEKTAFDVFVTKEKMHFYKTNSAGTYKVYKILTPLISSC